MKKLICLSLAAALPDSFFDVAYLNQYDRAYAVAVTLEG